MLFKTFLLEKAGEEKLVHLEHAEDHILNTGMEGFAHAYHTLEDVKDQIQGKKNNTKITTKYDGSPSIVFGHNPDNGQFFVASKSAFNVNPKLNYTFEDIEKNHGHSPGLVSKLKPALEHLPKIAPRTGVYQGDIMHTGGIKSESNPHGDVMDDGKKHHFKPNVITYSTSHNSPEGKKIAKSKLGVAIHTAYTGNTFKDLKAEYGADTSHFKSHPDVHMINVSDDAQHANMSADHLHSYQHHMEQARKLFVGTDKKAYNALAKHGEHLKTYINKTVREDTVPSVQGYQSHLKDKHLQAISKVKTAKAIGTKTDKMNEDLKDANKKAEHLEAILKMHHHLQAAKNQLVHSLSAKPKFEHTINGQKVKPEGYVVVRNGRPTKLVDRAEFSRANFLARPR